MIFMMLNADDNYGEDGCDGVDDCDDGDDDCDDGDDDCDDDDDDCDKFASNFDFTGVQEQQHESPVQFHFSGNIINISLKKFN